MRKNGAPGFPSLGVCKIMRIFVPVNQSLATMEKQSIQNPNGEAQKQPLTREEIWRRMKANRQHKQEFVERAIKRMTEEYKARYGKEPAGFEVW